VKWGLGFPGPTGSRNRGAGIR